MTAETIARPTTAGSCAPTPDEMRRVMGQFATGVTVVTGIDEEGPIGFACQSFASVSLEPALILICADHRGRAWPRIREAGRFCVNVLHEDQSELCGRFGSSRGRKYEELDWELSRWNTPSLPGVLMRVHAEVENVHVAGDHDVIIARVLELDTVCEERPMVFFRGKFGIEAPALV
ncbi:flavin reductase family protein [Prescottella subtropica]|uniref:flavin reductase family protein n=1 Tax=Prescottella subtropica TaxID=2545757 RepID=UPI0010F7DBD6|nr:flavin reductase family protein [Prescottella subtropica]